MRGVCFGFVFRSGYVFRSGFVINKIWSILGFRFVGRGMVGGSGSVVRRSRSTVD